jgi:hypothetical protein
VENQSEFSTGFLLASYHATVLPLIILNSCISPPLLNSLHSSDRETFLPAELF